MAYDSTTDPDLQAFFEVDPASDFPIQNLPLGIFRRAPGDVPHVGCAIGDRVLDLTVLEARDYFTDPALRDTRPFSQPTLNAFLALGEDVWRAARTSMSLLLSGENPSLKDDATLQEQTMVGRHQVEMLLPVAVGDYTDFYSSREHAVNVGSMFRGAEHALMPNWLHLPVAYHGRSSSIVVSGTEIVRPTGQIKPDDGDPVHEPSRSLDFELEAGYFVGAGTALGEPVSVDRAMAHVFGMVLVNDWSARDIQRWEYVPLGPFLGKNFATTISPWVVPLAALEPFRCAAPAQEPRPLPYLRESSRFTYDVRLEVALQGADEDHEEIVCRSRFRHLYWTMAQQVAHHTVNGCNLRPGDLLASGTISGPDPSSYGSLLELTWGGTRPLTLENGSRRTFLQDGDRVTMRGWAQGDGYRIGFGEATGTIVPASR